MCIHPLVSRKFFFDSRTLLISFLLTLSLYLGCLHHGYEDYPRYQEEPNLSELALSLNFFEMLILLDSFSSELVRVWPWSGSRRTQRTRSLPRFSAKLHSYFPPSPPNLLLAWILLLLHHSKLTLVVLGARHQLIFGLRADLQFRRMPSRSSPI